MSGFAEWVARAAGGESVRAIAKRLHRSPDTVSRWIRQGRMPAADLILFAQIYHAEILSGALAAGIVTAQDLEWAMPQLIRYASSVQLTAELHRRAVGRTGRTVA